MRDRELHTLAFSEMPAEVVKHVKLFARQNTVMHQVRVRAFVCMCACVRVIVMLFESLS